MSSPLDILIAIHYWTRPGDYAADNPEHAKSPAVRESIRRMCEAGLLRGRTSYEHPDNPANAMSTDALRVYIEALCNVPWPVQVWVIPKDDPT